MRGRDIAQRYGVSLQRARILLAEMVEAGVVGRHGAQWIGRAADVEAWLCGRWPSPTHEAAP